MQGILHSKSLLDKTVTEAKLSDSVRRKLNNSSGVTIVDNLNSNSNVSALAANQGRVLDEKKQDKEEGKGLSTNDMTNERANKLDSLPDNFNSFGVVSSGSGQITASTASDTLKLASTDSVQVNINSASKEISFISSGLSPAERQKLEGIESGAQVNQNAFSFVEVGDDIITAEEKTSTLTLVGGGATTVSASETSVTISSTDTTYNTATSSSDGLMSSTDKAKLDGMQSGGEVNQDAYSNIIVDGTSIAANQEKDSFSINSGSNIIVSPNLTAKSITIAGNYQLAAGGANGLMSATDKSKLDGISSGAEVNQNAFSSISTSDGSAISNSKTDILTVVGDGDIRVSAEGKTLTINSLSSSYRAVSTPVGTVEVASELPILTVRELSRYIQNPPTTAGDTVPFNVSTNADLARGIVVNSISYFSSSFPSSASYYPDAYEVSEFYPLVSGTTGVLRCNRTVSNVVGVLVKVTYFTQN